MTGAPLPPPARPPERRHRAVQLPSVRLRLRCCVTARPGPARSGPVLPATHCWGMASVLEQSFWASLWGGAARL